MSATFDATTTAAYEAATTAQSRAEAIVASLTGTITVTVYDGDDAAMGTGTMAAPWASASAGVVTLGEVSSFTVGTTATPDADWYIRFQNADVSRWARGSFGLSGADYNWSLATWESGQTGTIGTATIVAAGNEAPVFTVAPTTASIASTGGTIQFTATDPEGGSIFYSLTTTRAGITINASTGLVTVTAAAAGTSGNIVVQASDGILTTTTTCAVTVANPDAARLVWFTGAFESGQIMPYTGQTDGFYFGTLPQPQTGAEAYFTSTGGAGPSAALDTRVVASETIDADEITPRDGGYFLRSAIYKTKNYTDTRFSSGADRPRSVFYLTHSSNLLDWDTEAWFGMSVWLPSNMEHDTATKNEAAEVQLLVVNPNWPSNTHMDFKYYVGGSDTISRWALRYYVGATSTAESAATSTTVNLGLVTADIGRWTDWIFRVRFNPFTTTTNPALAGIANAKNQTYQGERGILEVWKNGTKVFSRVNQPLGLVPWTTRDLSFLPRLYKSNWKLFPTSVVGPVYAAFDSIRYGQVTRDGTGYADVNPTGTEPASGQEPA
jgi:hypothetical protein